MLACTRYFEQQYDLNKKENKPWLILLHGLLGDQQEWQTVLPYLSNWPCLTVDLPGHGQSSHLNVSSFDETIHVLHETLHKQRIHHYIMIGYSLGGRIAMYSACYNNDPLLKGLVIEGGNLGLITDDEKQARWLNDQHWAEKFRQLPMKEVLTQWYQQPVFADISEEERNHLVVLREHNQGEAIATMLEATSLAKQPLLTDKLQQKIRQEKLSFCYLCGQKDEKFQQIARNSQLPLKLILQAGHNAHHSNPEGFVQQLILFLKED